MELVVQEKAFLCLAGEASSGEGYCARDREREKERERDTERQTER